MRKIVNSTYITLDGVVDNLHEWPPIGDRGSKGDGIQEDLLLGCDTLIMGRRTYESFASVWATMSGDPYSDHINAMSKYVVSSTLTDPAWNNTTVIGDDPVAEIARLKEAPGKDIVQYGIGRLAQELMEHGLIDELHLWVYPLLLGKAEPNALLHTPETILELTGTTTLDNGVAILRYRIANAQEPQG